MIQETLTIQNKLGLHARAAMKLMNTASRFESRIAIEHKKRTVNAKSILGVMALGATKGSAIQIEIDGPDEQHALKALQTLINNKFDEEE